LEGRPSIVPILLGCLGVAGGVVVVVIVLSALVLFLFILVRVVSTGLRIVVCTSIAFSLSRRCVG